MNGPILGHIYDARHSEGAARADNGGVEISAIIPTCGRPEKLGACVAALARQYGDVALEVLVGVDGGDSGASERAARAAWGGRDGLMVIQTPRVGPGGVRNRLVPLARGKVAWFLNDDVAPGAGAATAHLAAQCAAARDGVRAMVVGDSPWRVHVDDTLFDRLIRETSMVFFYDRMRGGDARRDWGFRHAWTLNLSVPMDVVRGVPFREIPGEYGYDDVEFAWRVGLPVRYCPEARVLHDHRIGPAEYLERERALGRSAVAYVKRWPEFGRALFGRGILERAHVGRVRVKVERVEAESRAWIKWFEGLARLPVDGGDVRVMYERHLPLKRWMWGMGFLDAVDSSTGGTPVPPIPGKEQPRSATHGYISVS